MFNRPKILIGTDFSLNSDFALKMGKRFQNAAGGTITVVHVSGMPPLWDWLASDLQVTNLPDNFRQGLFSSLAKEMNRELRRCEVECENDIVFGDPYDELHKWIDEKKPDLLIMGHGGKSGFFHMGSLTQKMIASSPIPILAVNQDAPLESIGGLLDPSGPFSSIISASEELSYLLSTEIKYISIIPDILSFDLGYLFQVSPSFAFSEEEKEKIVSKKHEEISKRLDKHLNSSISVKVSPRKIPDAILEELAAYKIGLAVLSRHRRGPLEKFFIGSVGRRILERFKGNLLILPE